MLYLPVLGFAILSLIRLFQGNGTECFLFIGLTGLYLIPAVIQSIYQDCVKQKTLEYKTLGEVFENWGKQLKEEQIKREKELSKKGSTSDKI